MTRLATILICFFLTFGAVAQDADQPSGTISVEDNFKDDAAIAVRIRGILTSLDHYEDVTVLVSNGIVTLRGTTLETTDIARLNELIGRIEGIVAIENEVTETTNLTRRLSPAMERFQTRMSQFIGYLPLLLVAAIAFAIITTLGLIIAGFRQPWDRLAPNAFIADIYRQLLRLFFIVAAVVISLDILGAAALLSTILGAAGIIGLAIGFAVRDTVENFIASIMLSIRQPFRPNDTIEIGGDTGKVIRLTSRATILLSFDGNHIRIPNSTVFKSRIINFSRNNERRFVIDFGVAYGTDLSNARQIVHETLNSLPFVLKEPEANVWIQELGDSSVVLRAAAWIDQHQTSYSLAKGEAMRIILATFMSKGIEMPEPTFRLITDLPDTEKRPISRSRKQILHPKMLVEDVDASEDDALEKIINVERKALEDKDLLNRAAPEE